MLVDRMFVGVCAAATAGLLLAAPASATLVGFRNVSGANSAQITTSPPNPVAENPDDGILLGWNERQNVTLTSDLKVDRVFDATAPFVEAVSGGFVIKAGTIVSSHYLQWDSGNGSSERVDATIELDAQAFAFITADQKLFDSDAVLGLPGLDYNDFGLRGLENNDTTEFNGPNVDISWRALSPGDWTRLITAFSPAAAPELSTQGSPGLAAELDFGLVRVGTSAERGLTLVNTGGDQPSGLAGTVPTPDASGPFELVGTAAFGPLGEGEQATRTYRFTPTASDPVTQNVGSITSNDTEADADADAPLTLLGEGVAPVAAFATDGNPVVGGDTLDLGEVDPNGVATLTLQIANLTTDPNGGDDALTDLSLLDLAITGEDADAFSLVVIAPDNVLSKGGNRDVTLQVTGPAELGELNAMLTVQTDVGAALGGDGEDYSFQLVATVVPEPASALLLAAAGVTALARQRNAARR
jgi:hypothetical protein